MNKTIRSKPDVFQYVELLNFLGDIVTYYRSRAKPLSVREISKRAAFKSSSYLSMLLKGERKFSDASLLSLLNVFELSELEIEYAVALKGLSEARTPEDRIHIFERLKQIQNKKSVRKLAVTQLDRLNHWCMPVIYEALNTEWRKKTEDEMAKELRVESKLVVEILKELEKMKLIERDTPTTWKRLDIHFQTQVETFSKAIRGIHSQMLEKARESLNLPTTERAVFGQTIPLTIEGYQKVKEAIADDFKKIGADLTDVEHADQIYQMSFVIFPILKL